MSGDWFDLVLPESLTLWSALFLIAASAVTSAISAAFGLLGFVFTPWVLLLLVMVLAGFIGTWLGVRALKRIPEDTFKWVFKSVLTVLALRLVYVGLS